MPFTLFFGGLPSLLAITTSSYVGIATPPPLSVTMHCTGTNSWKCKLLKIKNWEFSSLLLHAGRVWVGAKLGVVKWPNMETEIGRQLEGWFAHCGNWQLCSSLSTCNLAAYFKGKRRGSVRVAPPFTVCDFSQYVVIFGVIWLFKIGGVITMTFQTTSGNHCHYR